MEFYLASFGILSRILKEAKAKKRIRRGIIKAINVSNLIVYMGYVEDEKEYFYR